MFDSEMRSEVIEASNDVMNGSSIPDDKISSYIDLFEKFECWQPFFKILSDQHKKHPKKNLESYIRLAKVQGIYLEDIFSAASTCKAMVRNFDLSFPKFHIEIIPQIIEYEDFISEAAILHSISDIFSAKEDQIACLERLAMLYEKKTYNDSQLAICFEKLINLDPTNIKALRYFKLVYTQNQDWESVSNLLKNILENVNHKQEKFRIAQELATVLLYQLELPQEALQYIDEYCAGSPLDTTRIQLDAYYKLHNWDGCLAVLEKSLLVESDVANRAILHFKIAEFFNKTGNKEAVKLNYEKAVSLWPEFFEPVEHLIEIAIQDKNWNEVLKLLNDVSLRTEDSEAKGNVEEAISRIKGGMANEQLQN